MKIIKNKTLVDDDWQVLRLGDNEAAENTVIPEGKVIVPLKVWQARRKTLQQQAEHGELGVWLASDERPEDLKQDIHALPVIAVDFPKFSDGRGYSIAYNLRTRLGFTGEVRAIGDVLRDQLFYMQRVGFDAFAPQSDHSLQDALKGFDDFSEVYQTSFDQKQPLFRRVQRKKNSSTDFASC